MPEGDGDTQEKTETRWKPQQSMAYFTRDKTPNKRKNRIQDVFASKVLL